LSLYWLRLTLCTPSLPISLRSISILSTHLRLAFSSRLFHLSFLTSILYAFLFSTMCAKCPHISSSLIFSIVEFM
jgi:hypothetical protein